MKFIKNSLRISNYSPKKKKLPVWAHPYKDLFHNDTSIISQVILKSQYCPAHNLPRP